MDSFPRLTEAFGFSFDLALFGIFLGFRSCNKTPTKPAKMEPKGVTFRLEWAYINTVSAGRRTFRSRNSEAPGVAALGALPV
jgi:hypothetical protein